MTIPQILIVCGAIYVAPHMNEDFSLAVGFLLFICATIFWLAGIFI